MDERDIMAIALDLDVPLSDFDSAVHEVVDSFGNVHADRYPPEIGTMLARVIDNASPRVAVLRRYLATG